MSDEVYQRSKTVENSDIENAAFSQEVHDKPADPVADEREVLISFFNIIIILFLLSK